MAQNKFLNLNRDGFDHLSPDLMYLSKVQADLISNFFWCET